MSGVCLGYRHGSAGRGGGHGWPEPLAVDGYRRSGHGPETGPEPGHSAGPGSAGKPAAADAQHAKDKTQGQDDPDYFQEVFHNRKCVE